MCGSASHPTNVLVHHGMSAGESASERACGDFGKLLDQVSRGCRIRKRRCDEACVCPASEPHAVWVPYPVFFTDESVAGERPALVWVAAAERVQAAEFRRIFLENIYKDICADLDVAILHTLHERRIMRRVGQRGDHRSAVRARELREIEGFSSIGFIGEEAHFHCIPGAVESSAALAWEVSRVCVQERGAALVDRFLSSELQDVHSDAPGVSRVAAAPLVRLAGETLAKCAAERANVGERGEQSVLPIVAPAPVGGDWSVSVADDGAGRVGQIGTCG